MQGSSRILGLFLALNLDILLRKACGASIAQKTDCVIASLHESRYIQAYLEHGVDKRLSCASNATTTVGQEVHVVNLVELSHVSIPTPFEVSVTVKPHQNRGKYRKPLVIVLMSDIPTTWRVETIKIRDASPIRHLFVISKHSTILFHNFSLRQSVLKRDGIPEDSQSLAVWVEKMYGQLTSFSELSGVNALLMEVGIHTVPGLPPTCDIIGRGMGASFIKGSYRENRDITCCVTPKNVNRNSKSVHVIEVSGDLQGVKSEIVVEIVPEILGSVRSELVLLLKSPPDLSWKVKSRKVQGNIEVVGNSVMDTEEVNMETVETRVETLPYSGKDLVSWVEYRYGPILSYSGIPNSNHIILLVPEQDSVREDKHPRDYPPYLSKSSSTKLSPFKNPSRTEMDVRRSMSVSCEKNGMMVYIPKTVAQAYGIREEYLSLRSSACRAHSNASHYILSTTFHGCNTQLLQQHSHTAFSNALVIKSITWADRHQVSTIMIGSGDGSLEKDDDDEFSGSGFGGIEGDNSAADSTRLDDEDYHVQALEIGITCTKKDASNNKDYRFFLDVFSGPRYESLEEDPIVVKPGSTIFAQASVLSEDPGVHLQIINCGLHSRAPPTQKLVSIVQQGCIVEPSGSWLITASGNDVLTSSFTLRFTFQVPLHLRVSEFDIVCDVVPCSQSGVGSDSKLLKCSHQDEFCMKQHSTSPQHIPKSSIIQVTTDAITLHGDGSRPLLQRPLGNGPFTGFAKPFPESPDFTTLSEKSGQPNEAPPGTIIMEGLDSGTVIGIAFAAFVIGVMLTAALWYIHAHTGPVKQGGPTRGWAESSGETTPCSTAPIHIST